MASSDSVMSLSKLQGTMEDRKPGTLAVHGVAKSKAHSATQQQTTITKKGILRKHFRAEKHYVVRERREREEERRGRGEGGREHEILSH